MTTELKYFLIGGFAALYLCGVLWWLWRVTRDWKPKPATKSKAKVFRHYLRLKLTDGKEMHRFYFDHGTNVGPVRGWRSFLKWYHTGTTPVHWIEDRNRRIGIVRERIAVFDMVVEEVKQ